MKLHSVTSQHTIILITHHKKPMLMNMMVVVPIYCFGQNLKCLSIKPQYTNLPEIYHIHLALYKTKLTCAFYATFLIIRHKHSCKIRPQWHWSMVCLWWELVPLTFLPSPNCKSSRNVIVKETSQEYTVFSPSYLMGPTLTTQLYNYMYECSLLWLQKILKLIIGTYVYWYIQQKVHRMPLDYYASEVRTTSCLFSAIPFRKLDD
jgi:hypothetical protein